MNTTKLVMAYAIVILSLSINLVYTQATSPPAANENSICLRLRSVNRLCNVNVAKGNSPITAGVPGKRGQKGAKGDSSTYDDNAGNYNRLYSKLVSLHKQLTSVQDENQRLRVDLDDTKKMCNNKISGVEDQIQVILSLDDNRFQLCGLLQRPSEIADNQFSASSTWHSYAEGAAYQARLFSTSGYGSWHAHNEENQWIQVDLEQNKTIVAVATQGRHKDSGYLQWITLYSVSYQTVIDGSFRTVNDESGDLKVFQGNTDSDTYVINNFPEEITARIFRITPVTYEAWPVIRFDLLTC